MLLIAIPKSASTSLMTTLGKIHKLKALQDHSFMNECDVPKEAKIIHKFHRDIREVRTTEVVKFNHKHIFHKQHIFPSVNNTELVKDIKKVVLLRSVEDIIMAYKRGAIKNVHRLLEGYSVDLSDEEWLDLSIRNGLYDDLRDFRDGWLEQADENTLIIEYSNLLINPKLVINEIEKFWNLKVSKENIILSKKRYSRRSHSYHRVYIIYKWLRKRVKRLRKRIVVFVKRIGLYDPYLKLKSFLFKIR